MKTATRRAILAVAAVVSTAANSSPSLGKPTEHLVTLCAVLQAVLPGERIPVRVAGIYVTGPERQLFYDPKQPTCEDNIQPSTWVEFAPSMSLGEDLQRLLAQSSRALVVFGGELYGPGVVGPDSLSLAPNVAFANRVAARRYGHLNAFRTKFAVSEVLSVAAVPATQPWDAVWAEPPQGQGIEVLGADLPRYPSLARRAGISGTVVADIAVEDGRVVSTRVRSGDRMLATEAVVNIASWRFGPGTKASFTTTFVYRIERRGVADQQPVIELHLPDSVKVTAPSYDW